MQRYNPTEIEPKWQKYWDENQTYKADLTSDKPKYIAMSMFNYPSGSGIHIGHAMNYTISDVMARFRRQQGFESYHPVGWDSFGLPAENYAIKTGVSPQQSMATIIPGYHKQYKAMGWSNDWSKEIATHEPIYYKWTQWLFTQMYNAGLAYQDSRMQWWCDIDKTVLSNEQVIDGKCWRHDGVDDPLVEKREIKQWFFKITDYAEELLEATDALDWTESVKTAQKNWIGKSQGAEIEFLLSETASLRDSSLAPAQTESRAAEVSSNKNSISVFTTRPDTLFGVTFLVLAPEHELVSQLVTDDTRDAVDAYIKEVAKKTEVERQAAKEKTGVFTGSYAINPINGEKIPIWIADYVLVGYGTGAIMAVPAHDERDAEFAEKFSLPIISVVAPDFGQPLLDAKDVTGPVVVGYDPRTKEFMSLLNANARKSQSRWLVGGGLEEGETYEEAARREIHEEAGFATVEAMIQLGDPTYSYYYNDNKKSNRRSFSYMYLAIVDKNMQGEQVQESHESYQVVWSDLDAIRKDWEGDKSGVEHWLETLARIPDALKSYENGQRYISPPYHHEGVLFNSGEFDGMTSADAREKIVAWLEKEGLGASKTTFKIRDWSVSRQRYWGAPIPMIDCPSCGAVPVPEDQLPVVLPELDDFAPSGDGRSALARATDWLHVDCPKCGGPAERETDTLDTYICSSWYMLRYLDPHNKEKIFDSAIANKWAPIDFYNGGDHATAHMIYARFMTRFLQKQGLLENPEPFKKFLFNGKVTAANGEMFSKSKGNGVDPLEIISSGYGADALRTYLMFAAPLDQWMRWDPQGVPGTFRFLNRIWTLVQQFSQSNGDGESSDAILKVVHPAIVKVSRDIEDQKYNTAIATMMKLTNDLYDLKAKDAFGDVANWRFALESLVQLVAPFAPHMAEELWHQLGHEDSVNVDHWPVWDQAYLVAETLTIAVQVNGKLRGEIEVVADAGEDEIKATALAHENVAKFVDGTPKKVIYVAGRLVSVVV